MNLRSAFALVGIAFNLSALLAGLPILGTLAQQDDVYPPTINLITRFPVITFEGVKVTIEADIIDSSGVQSATIAYRVDGTDYLAPMVLKANYRYEWTYLNNDIGSRSELVVLILNITAVDVYSNKGTQTYVNTTITVLKEDAEGPEIQLEAMPLYTESEDHLIIRASVTDPSDVGSVVLYYDKAGMWFERTMTYNPDNELYEAIIGPFETDTAVRYYVNATDASKNRNEASTLQADNGTMRSFVISYRMRFEGGVDDSNYLQVEQLHRYRMTKSRDTITYAGYVFNLELSDSGLLTGQVSLNSSGKTVVLKSLSLVEKNNELITDMQTKDGIAYDFNLKYLSYRPEGPYAEIEINPRQRLVFEGYTIYTYIKKVTAGDWTFIGQDGGKWQVNVTASLGYSSVTRTFTARNQFKEFFVGGRRDVQIIYLGEELVPGDLIRYRARLRVYKFQQPIFDVKNDVPTGSPSGLSPGQIIYNVYAGDILVQKVIAQNLAGSRAYDINIQVTNITGYGLAVSPGELTASLGPVYREKTVGNKTVRYYLTYGTLTRSFNLAFPRNVQVRESARFDVLLTYRDAHAESHQIRIPVQFLIYPSPPVLRVTKGLSREELPIGHPAAAWIEIENTGGSPALNVTVIDNTPPNLISDFETWRGEIKPGSSNKVYLMYSLKATTITVPGRTSYGFVTVDWKGVCYKAGVRNDAYTLSTDDFFFTALGPHLAFIQFTADRPIVDQGGQQMIFINLGEKVTVTATVKNDGNRIAKNMSLSFPGFVIESTNFPTGTDLEDGMYVQFSATIVAASEGTYPFQAMVTHYDENPVLGNVYRALSHLIMAQTYRSPVMVQFIDPPRQISAGETETISLSIRNIGNSPVENARVLLSLSRGLELVYGTYLIWEGRLGPNQNELKTIQIKGKEFGPNKIVATASGRDIPDVDYELPVEVLSPHIEILRTIDCEYLLARPDYWPRSSEIASRVTLTLRNVGNDLALRVVVKERLPAGLITFENLTLGSDLIVWGEMGDISLAPNESIALQYPVWARNPGHYFYAPAVVTYTNPIHTRYESTSNTLDVWALSSRPFLVDDGPVLVLGSDGAPLSGPVSYNDTVTFVVKIKNIGNQNATALQMGQWLGEGVPDIKCIVLNQVYVREALESGIRPESVLSLPIKVLVLEDVPSVASFALRFPLSYRDSQGRSYASVFSSQLEVRPTQVGVSFKKSFVRSYVGPGERPQLRIEITNVGDTDLSSVRAIVEVPGGLSIASSPVLDLLRESEKATIVVEFQAVSLPPGEVYVSFRGFVASVEYMCFRGRRSTPEDGIFLDLSVVRPYIEVTRSATSQVLLARSEEWPFSPLIHENVTLTLRNTAEIEARGVTVTENIPDGLYTLQSLGTSQIVWGKDGKLNLGKGETVSFTYPVWSFAEATSNFEPAVVTYSDPAGHRFQSYSTGVEKLVSVANRPYIVWEGGIVQDPAGSVTYNDTLELRMSVRNVGNSRSTGLVLTGWTDGKPSHPGWELLNSGELSKLLSNGIAPGSVLEFALRLRVLKDVRRPEEAKLPLELWYGDEMSRTYSREAVAEVLVRPPAISISAGLVNGRFVVMPRQPGFLNLSVSNAGDTDLTNVAFRVECPDGVSVASADNLDVLAEGGSRDMSIVFGGIELGEKIGRNYDKINVSISYADFRGEQHTMKIGVFNLTVKRPMLTVRTFEARSKTRLGGKYGFSLVLGNDGTFEASSLRILLGDMVTWLGDIAVAGGILDGDRVMVTENLSALNELQVQVKGKVQQKGRFVFSPVAIYSDAAGNEYRLELEAVQVRIGEKIFKTILPFLLWAAAGAAIVGIYYYETRIAEKIKGHQLGSLANSVITHVDATRTVPPLIPFRKKKLSLAEFAYLLSLYLAKVKATNPKRADRTTFIITHPQSRLVPGQEFKNLAVVRDAYLLLADMIQNRVKSSQTVPPTFLVQGFKFGLSDVVYMLSLAVSRARSDGQLPKSVTIPASTRISAVEKVAKEAPAPEEVPKAQAALAEAPAPEAGDDAFSLGRGSKAKDEESKDREKELQGGKK